MWNGNVIENRGGREVLKFFCGEVEKYKHENDVDNKKLNYQRTMKVKGQQVTVTYAKKNRKIYIEWMGEIMHDLLKYAIYRGDIVNAIVYANKISIEELEDLLMEWSFNEPNIIV